MTKEYIVIQYTQGTITAKIEANSEEEALRIWNNGDCSNYEHEWEENGECFIDE